MKTAYKLEVKPMQSVMAIIAEDGKFADVTDTLIHKRPIDYDWDTQAVSTRVELNNGRFIYEGITYDLKNFKRIN